MESQEMERRMMAREEERSLRRLELLRRRREKEPRAFQEKGFRLFQGGLQSLVRASATLRRLHWVRAWTHNSIDDSVTAQVRDPADGKFYLCRLLVCRYETDCSFVEKETNDLEDLHHPNVVGIKHASTYKNVSSNPTNGMYKATNWVAGIVTEFCPGGQIVHRCSPSHPMPVDNEQMVQWATQTCAGLRAMHAMGITHRNLNPGNVHLDARGRAVITGFQCLKAPRAPGCAYSYGRSDCGSPSVIAPEVEDLSREVTPSADMWAFGCCLFAWMTNKDDLPHGLMRDLPVEKALQRVPARFGPKLRSALRMTLQHHPDKRATAKDLLAMLRTSRR